MASRKPEDAKGSDHNPPNPAFGGITIGGMALDEIGRRGRALYDRHKDELERNHWGHDVIFNVATGEFLVQENTIENHLAFIAKFGVVPAWGRRIGELDRI